MQASEKDLPVPSFLLPRTWRRMLHNCLQASTFAKASDSCTQCIFLIIFPENENALKYTTKLHGDFRIEQIISEQLTKSLKNKFSCLAGIQDYTKKENDGRQKKKE